MTKSLYFQWQNEILCHTIYPMREAKLRDFLVFYKEVDLWKNYKGRSAETLQGEVKAYLDAQAKVMVEAVRDHTRLRDYFLVTDVEAYYGSKFSQVDPVEMTEIKNLHDAFKTYFPKYHDVRKEKNFVSDRFTAYGQRRKNALQRIALKERRLDNMLPDHPNRPAEQQELEAIRTVMLGMIEHELDQLDDFLGSFKLIEPRKLELDKTKQANLQRQKQLEAQLKDLQAQASPLQAQSQEAAAELARLKNPPDLKALEATCTAADVTGRVRAKYPQASQALLDALNGIHKELAENYNYTKSIDGKAGAVRTYYWRMKEYQRALEKQITQYEAELRNMPETWSLRPDREAALFSLREAGRQAVAEELDSLSAFQSALLNSQKSPQETAAAIAAKEKEAATLTQKLTGLQSQITALQSELNNIETALAVPDEVNLVKIVPAKPVSVQDIVQGQVDAYKASLMQKNHLQLLEDVVQFFLQQPERFPLWLQYMVIHFSGMRYASAHGSWADPKDLLARLRAPKVEEEVSKLDDDTIAKLCQEKIAVYESAGGVKPRLASAQEKEWRNRIGWNLANMKASGPKTRRRGLLDMRKDEVTYEIKNQPTQQVLETLLSMKAQFPSWAWKEIVRLTPLRVTEVSDTGWEKLTSQEEQERYQPQYNGLRTIIDAWKNFDISAWREEHGRTHQLIVSRAVCNETAEHIQHIRGYLPPGGLAARPPWYLKNESEQALPGTPRPYFVKATSEKDYTRGASVLWLRFSDSQPDPWQIAKTIQTKAGVGLLPDDFRGRKAGNKTDGVWNYQQGEIITRSRTLVREDKQHANQRQWLRWIHEATVVDVAETADGTVILTFETALPDDDRGTSSIGMFKKSLNYFLSDGTEDGYNRSFVGYVPEGQIPAEHLEEMLDWNKILRRQVMSPADLDAYRKKYIRRN